ncbi:MAG TPA: GPW/gp25 family protein [Acidimicrobiia bacterium]|nr:GPW/gp25 family protein [Acidimicrobiia bacterium]
MTGVDFPFDIDLAGRTKTVDRSGYVRGLIEQLLFTNPGERVHRVTFGAGLSQLVFEPGGDEVAAALQFGVQGALQQWLGDAIEVHDVDVVSAESTLSVTVRYSLRPDPEVTTETFTSETP